jgi:hypothetical protein
MRAFVLAVLVSLGGPASAQQKAPTVRPEVGKPLQAAVEVLKAKRGKDALARVREAQAVPNKTPYETYLVTRLLGQAAAAAGEHATAAAALQNAAGANAAPESERLELLAGAASEYYAAKDYRQAAAVALRYLQGGGTQKAVRTVYLQSLYLGGNYSAAARELASDVAAAERAGRMPAEEELRLLADACLKAKDTSGYRLAMEKLIAYHPKREYWLAVLQALVAEPDFGGRLAIDLARLRLEVGAMRGAEDYVDHAELALVEGFALEASQVIDKGYAAGVLGRGAEAARHARLKDVAAKNVADEETALAASGRSAAKGANALFHQGFANVFHGKAERGLPMMREAIKAGAFAPADHAKLELGYAYHLARQKAQAMETFKTVQGKDGAAALARLWIIHLSRPS